jgi:hypothetical protein
MLSLYDVCVWVIPFPPSSTSIDTTGSNNIYFTDSCLTGISNNSIENRRIGIYPNPYKNCINVQFENINNSDLEILNSIGETIYFKQLRNAETEQINTSDYPKGIYYLRIKTNDYIKTEKIIKD